LRLEHLISLGCELLVRIVDQVTKLDALVFEPPAELPSLLSHPRLGWFGRKARRQDPPSRQVDEEEDVEAPKEDRVHRNEVSRDHAFGASSRQPSRATMARSRPCFGRCLSRATA